MTTIEKEIIFLEVVANLRDFRELYTKHTRGDILSSIQYKWVEETRANLENKQYIKKDEYKNYYILTSDGREYLKNHLENNKES